MSKQPTMPVMGRPPRASLMGLPGEIRMMIWRYVFTHIPHKDDDPRASHVEIKDAYMPTLRYGSTVWIKSPPPEEIAELATKRESNPDPPKYVHQPVMSISHQRNNNSHSMLRLITLNKQIYHETWSLFYEMNTLLFSNKAAMVAFARHAPAHIKEVITRIACVITIEAGNLAEGDITNLNMPLELCSFVSLDRIHFFKIFYTDDIVWGRQGSSQPGLCSRVRHLMQFTGLESRMSCITTVAIQLKVSCKSDFTGEHLKYQNDHDACASFQGRNFLHDEETYTTLLDSEWWRDPSQEAGAGLSLRG